MLRLLTSPTASPMASPSAMGENTAGGVPALIYITHGCVKVDKERVSVEVERGMGSVKIEKESDSVEVERGRGCVKVEKEREG